MVSACSGPRTLAPQPEQLGAEPDRLSGIARALATAVRLLPHDVRHALQRVDVALAQEPEPDHVRHVEAPQALLARRLPVDVAPRREQERRAVELDGRGVVAGRSRAPGGSRRAAARAAHRTQ